MRITLLRRVATLALLVSAPASAQDASAPAVCAGLAPDSVEAAILGCFRPTSPPAPVLPDGESADEPIPDALAAPLPVPRPAPVGDAAIADPEPPASPPARDDELVQVFADWFRRYPTGSTLDPAEARLLAAEEVPAGLPALPPGRSYAEVDGMTVELDPETGELLRLVRRAPVLAEAPQAPPARPEVVQAEDGARGSDDITREEAEREAAEQEIEEAAREAEERADEERKREEEQAREVAEREAEEQAREREQAREDDRNEDRGRGEERRRGEAQAYDIPNGHMPPPGSCRVWYPDRPPGQQPPPGPCNVRVPAGAVLIRG